MKKSGLCGEEADEDPALGNPYEDDIEEPDPGKPPSRALTDATVAVAINAIPHVVAAPPGLFAFHPPAAWRQA